ncbi:MAG TPA: efflux transporter outer membrane subunit [Gemmatimonadales bacterium]|nr:efflux transporter outer membrane subunit [Gemmatimonadales bacterium]
MSHLRSGFLAVAAVVLIVGCAIGPGYRRPALSLPDSWRPPASSEDSLRQFFDSLRTRRDTLLPPGADTARVPFRYDTAAAAGAGGRSDSTAALQWVDLFEDPVLRQLVDTALEQNRDVRTALAVIDEFRARYRATRGGLLPEITASGEGGRNAQAFGPLGIQTFNVYRASVDGRWELDLWGRLRRATQAARADLLAQEENRRAVELALISTAATAYVDLRAADLDLEIARRTLDSRRQTLTLAHQRLDQGLISELDVRQFEAEVASPAASVAQFERAVAQQENELSLLVGRTPGMIARGRSLTQLVARIPITAGVPAGLLSHRPDVRSAAAELRAATARIGEAQGGWLPSITLTGAYGTQSARSSQLFASGTNIWQAFVGVSLPLFTEGRPGNEQVAIARARAEQSRARYDQTVLAALRDVENALVALRTAQDETTSLQGQAVALRRALELANQRYQNGVSSYLDVLDAQRGLFSAELSLTQAERNQLVDAIALYVAVGAVWPGAVGQ